MASMLGGIYMNTKGGGSIALISCNEKSYIKETYTDADVMGELRKSKRINLPISRDGITYESVRDLFRDLITKGEYLPVA